MLERSCFSYFPFSLNIWIWILTVWNFWCGVIKIHYENSAPVLRCVRWVLLSNMWRASLNRLCSEVFIAGWCAEELLVKTKNNHQKNLPKQTKKQNQQQNTKKPKNQTKQANNRTKSNNPNQTQSHKHPPPPRGKTPNKNPTKPLKVSALCNALPFLCPNAHWGWCFYLMREMEVFLGQ